MADARAIKEGSPPHYTEWTPRHVRTEQQALGLPEGHYLRLPTADHLRPEDAVLERFVHFLRNLRGEAQLHFHCRGGKGRTSLFLTLLDVFCNARDEELEAIDEAWVVVDAGTVINPDRVRAQMEGSIIFGVSRYRRANGFIPRECQTCPTPSRVWARGIVAVGEPLDFVLGDRPSDSASNGRGDRGARCTYPGHLLEPGRE